jgi:hypothetical protein
VVANVNRLLLELGDAKFRHPVLQVVERRPGA